MAGATVTEHQFCPTQSCNRKRNKQQLLETFQKTQQKQTNKDPCFGETYSVKSIIGVKSMAASLTVATTSPFRCPKASKLHGGDLLSRPTLQMHFGMQRFVNFSRSMQLVIHQRWLPFIDICTNSVHFPSHHRDPVRISSPFLKHNQKIATWFQPRPWDMVPTKSISKNIHQS